MSIVAGVDFGTLSVRVSIVDSERGRLGSGVGEYPLHRRRDDPDYATQSHADHMRALAEAVAQALAAASVPGNAVEALAIDTTGSSVIPVDENLQPIDDYYLWCDHRAWREAAQITETAHRAHLDAIDWCGGVYSSEWGFSKLLHWLRHNPEKRARVRHRAGALRHGGGDAVRHSRSAPGPAQHLRHGPQVDVERSAGRLAAGRVPGGRRSAAGGRARADSAGATPPPTRSPAISRAEWADALGLRAGIPIPVGAFDAHWDAIGAGVRPATWSTWSAPPPASWPSPATADPDSRRLRRGPGLDPSRLWPASKPAFPPPAISSMPSRAAPEPPWPRFPKVSNTTAPARPACCASPGTTATAPCW